MIERVKKKKKREIIRRFQIFHVVGGGELRNHLKIGLPQSLYVLKRVIRNNMRKQLCHAQMIENSPAFMFHHRLFKSLINFCPLYIIATNKNQ